ncbi:hypothetical protein LV89_02114 [Arcicella aurantiaca]|uniref:Uncharacterized protein n=1 Tax=Arcicella aurantiaca TaxID=591202 RepID=A0A316EUK4_9BACT|nr:hypothetical protein [Arcicella aurantiaca]PWK26908.1 hypothetical protein LV89_02114 [Arcicella aurantiaca]
MQKISQINFTKLIGISILMIVITEVIPNHLIKNPDWGFIYKIAFLGILTILTLAFAIMTYRKKDFADINNTAILSLLSFWTIYSWIQYLS